MSTKQPRQGRRDEDRVRLAEHQRERLRYLLAHATANSPFPARRLAGIGVGRFEISDLPRLPVMTKAEIGYAITLEPARSDDLAPLLMRAWALTLREREVARLVIDGLSTDDIAAALFISHTVRHHLKAIFGKVGISRRRDLAATLTGRIPAEGG